MEDTEIRPVDDDGIVFVVIGTGIWFVALIVLIALHRQLEDAGRLWWIAVAGVGFGLGLVGIVYSRRRRERIGRR